MHLPCKVRDTQEVIRDLKIENQEKHHRQLKISEKKKEY